MDRGRQLRVVHRGLMVSIVALLLAAGIAVAATEPEEDPRTSARTGEHAAPQRSTTTSSSTTSSLPPVVDTSTTVVAPGTTATGRRPTTTTAPAGDPTDAPEQPPAAPAPPPASDGCGAPMQKRNGSLWECSFVDDFDGSTLDRSKWQVQQTKYGGYHSGAECFVDSPNNVAVRDGSLRLTVRQEPNVFTCQGGTSLYRSQWTSGMVTTWYSFKQTYGRFEFRARVSNPGVYGLHSAFWLYPRDREYGGPWPKSGEIDVAEIFSLYPDKAVPHVHYNGQTDDPNRTRECVVGDTGEWHTYALEWTAEKMVFIFDGNVCLENVWHPWAPQRHPQPFDKPFYVAITQALGIGYNKYDGNAPLPATTEVDYVRVWK